MAGLNLSDMIDALFGVKTFYRINPVIDEVDATVTQILAGDPRRLFLLIMNLSGNAIYIAPDNQVATTRGIYLAPTGGSISLIWDRDMELVSQPWFGISTAANQDIFVIETLSR